MNCGTCKFWHSFTNYENVSNIGECNEIKEKVTADVTYGWSGGYIDRYETEEDFGCTLWKAKEADR